MARVTIEDCLGMVRNRYELVHLCTTRTRQIFRGSHYIVESNNGPIVTALREIAAGKVRFLPRREVVVPPPSVPSLSTPSTPEEELRKEINKKIGAVEQAGQKSSSEQTSSTEEAIKNSPSAVAAVPSTTPAPTPQAEVEPSPTSTSPTKTEEEEDPTTTH